MHNIFRKKKRETSNHHSNNNNVGGHSSGSSHSHHGSTGSSHRASSGTKPTNFNYQSLNSHLINGSAAAAINNPPVLNIQQHHLSGNGAPPSDVNGSRNSSASLFSSLLPTAPSTSTQKASNSECHSFSHKSLFASFLSMLTTCSSATTF